MGNILCDWNPDEKRQLLAKAYDVLPAGGALIVYDGLIDDSQRAGSEGRHRPSTGGNLMIEKPKRATPDELAQMLALMRAAGARPNAPLSRLDGSGAWE